MPDDQNGSYIWVSDIMEYLFCPRFIYYERVLKIPRFEELRVKVMIGRDIHEKKVKTLSRYLRRRLNVKSKKADLKVMSRTLGLSGVIDELLFFEDGTVGPLDYKFSKTDGWIHTHLFYQNMIYGVLAEELFGLPSNRGYIVYTRSSNRVERIDFPEDKRERTMELVKKVLDIIVSGVYPEVTARPRQCADCTYRKICLQ